MRLDQITSNVFLEVQLPLGVAKYFCWSKPNNHDGSRNGGYRVNDWCKRSWRASLPIDPEPVSRLGPDERSRNRCTCNYI